MNKNRIQSRHDGASWHNTAKPVGSVVEVNAAAVRGKAASLPGEISDTRGGGSTAAPRPAMGGVNASGAEKECCFILRDCQEPPDAEPHVRLVPPKLGRRRMVWGAGAKIPPPTRLSRFSQLRRTSSTMPDTPDLDPPRSLAHPVDNPVISTDDLANPWILSFRYRASQLRHRSQYFNRLQYPIPHPAGGLGIILRDVAHDIPQVLPRQCRPD